MCKDVVYYSLIIPLHNEEENIAFVSSDAVQVFETLGKDYEILFVNDGSTDSTLEQIKKVKAQNQNIRIITSEQRRGVATALQAGFDFSKGHTLITMDGDGQLSAQDIPKLIKQIDLGHDFVFGVRAKRQDSDFKVMQSRIGNFIRKLFTRDQFQDIGCSLRAFRKETLKDIFLHSGWHRLIGVILAKQGFQWTEVSVQHFSRRSGQSKFGLQNRVFQSGWNLLQLIYSTSDCSHSKGNKPSQTWKEI